ncbi:hypothetical protein [Glycomyces sp. NPDC048151]|uniref:hypothetical protein n=1 Tax=Glycomyces sp. NPDC048151 TaxID=3364002 RepID=UPI0037182D18
MAKKKKRGPDTMSFLVLARTESGAYPHPVEVALYPDGANSIAAISIGPHAANAGGLVHLSGLIDQARGELNPAHKAEFDAAELHWLVPFLVRLQAGEDVTKEIVAAYRERHGSQPETMLLARTRS